MRLRTRSPTLKEVSNVAIMVAMEVLVVTSLSHDDRKSLLRTMCGSRTGGWSLPGVMSDRQHCVD
jgi:hypothetical protein